MDALEIFKQIDIYGKQAVIVAEIEKSKTKLDGYCESCHLYAAVLLSNRRFCDSCYSFLGACAGNNNFRGLLFASNSEWKVWISSPAYYFPSASPEVYIGKDWLARGFDFIYRYKPNGLYVFGQCADKSSFTLENLRPSYGDEMIYIGGPVFPVVEYGRDARWLRRSAIRKQIELNSSGKFTPEERFVSVMSNAGMTDGKGLKKWTL